MLRIGACRLAKMIKPRNAPTALPSGPGRVAALTISLGIVISGLMGCSMLAEEASPKRTGSPTAPEGSSAATDPPVTAEHTSKQCVGRQSSSGSRTDSRPLALGAFVRGVESEPGRIIDQFTEMVGEKPAIVLFYQNWESDSAFDPAMLDAVADRGATPIVTWTPRDPERGRNQRKYSLEKIINGRHDPYIRRWARGAAAWENPLYLRFAHEMNSAFYSWGVGINGNTGGEYVTAWRHIHGIFAEEGADNVRWVWSPLADVPTTEAELEQIYPGDDYVDWLALDGYNWGTEGLALARWRTVAEIFGPSYDKLTSISDKPVMIAEVASAEAGGSKADWIEEGLLEDVPSRLPRVRAVVWFSSNKLMDWRVNSSPESLAAYRRVAASCLYQGQLP